MSNDFRTLRKRKLQMFNLHKHVGSEMKQGRKNLSLPKTQFIGNAYKLHTEERKK